MNQINTGKRSLGINFTDNGQAEVILWAPEVENVTLVIQNKEEVQLEKVDFGYWKVVTNKISPGDLYKFRLNNHKELPDPASLSQPEGVHGPSRALNLQSSFQELQEDSTWKNLPQEQYIIYEL